MRRRNNSSSVNPGIIKVIESQTPEQEKHFADLINKANYEYALEFLEYKEKE